MNRQQYPDKAVILDELCLHEPLININSIVCICSECGGVICKNCGGCYTENVDKSLILLG